MFEIVWIVNIMYGVLSQSQWLQQLLGIIFFHYEFDTAFDCPFMQHLLCTMAPVIAIQTLIIIFLQYSWIGVIFASELWWFIMVLFFCLISHEENIIDKQRKYYDTKRNKKNNGVESINFLKNTHLSNYSAHYLAEIIKNNLLTLLDTDDNRPISKSDDDGGILSGISGASDSNISLILINGYDFPKYIL